MIARILAVLMVLAATHSIAQEAPDPGKESLVDEGLFVVNGRAGIARAEEFSIFKRPDGGYTLLNTITADDDSYIASGTWNFDADWRVISANGQSDVKGLKRKIEVKRETSPEGPIVRIKRQTIPKDGDNIRIEEFTAACDMNCLIDMAPAALPMAVMPRRYDMAKGGEQMFKWVGVSFIDDRILTDGGAALWLNRMQEAGGQQIAHWRFREDMPGPDGGRMQMNMHLWTDAKVTLRKFGVGRTEKPSTIGIRETDERFSSEMSAD